MATEVLIEDDGKRCIVLHYTLIIHDYTFSFAVVNFFLPLLIPYIFIHYRHTVSKMYFLTFDPNS